MNKTRVLWITQTALFIALLVSAQAVTRPLGQFVTGSCVNFILVSSCILIGFSSAAVVAVVSPIFAFLLIGTPVFPVLIPFMMAGNLAFVTVIHWIAGNAFANLGRRGYYRIGLAAAAGAVVKFLVLWMGIVKIGLTLIPDIKPPQIEALSLTFSWPQLVTAFIGSSLAVMIMPHLKNALKPTGVNAQKEG